MVAPDAGSGELIQNILGLMEGHQTHTKQGEAETQSDTTDIRPESKVRKTTVFSFAICCSDITAHMETFTVTKRCLSDL